MLRPDMHPIYAGFWRRLGALAIDVVLLGIAGAAIGYFGFDFLVQVGRWGRCIGFVLALVYFGLQNSSVGGGQTPGKRLFKIKVVDARGAPLTVAASLLRFVPLGLPWFLNNAQLPANVLLGWPVYLLSIALFGLGLALIYLFVFNRPSRRSVHDLLVGSSVVDAAATSAAAGAPLGRLHAVVMVCIVAASSLAPLFARRLVSSAPFESVLRATELVAAQPEVRYAQVFKGWSSGGTRKTTFVQVIAFLDVPRIEDEARARQLARQVLGVEPSFARVDSVQVVLVYGYDLGIASAWNSRDYVQMPAAWLAR